jgi:hypothetical protein
VAKFAAARDVDQRALEISTATKAQVRIIVSRRGFTTTHCACACADPLGTQTGPAENVSVCVPVIETPE